MPVVRLPVFLVQISCLRVCRACTVGVREEALETRGIERAGLISSFDHAGLCVSDRPSEAMGWSLNKGKGGVVDIAGALFPVCLT